MKLALVLLAATISAPLSAQTWSLAWSDEFNGEAGSAPNPANWKYDTGTHNGFGNGEIEYYCAFSSNDSPCSTDRPNAFMDGAGHLVIKAIRTDGQWTSARLLTQGRQAFKYGRIEARIKMQPGDGFWPAFWMLGDDIDQVGWPRSGEQDILEWVQKYGPGKTSSTVHGPGYSGGKGIGSTFSFLSGGRINEFHTYGVIWSEDKMQFYRDNPAQPYFTVTPSSLPAGAAWVYNQPFFLLLNFALGSGGFAGPTDATTPETGQMLVDYVRVYQSAAEFNPGSLYTIGNQADGLCATWRNGIELSPCDGRFSQQWRIVKGKGGYGIELGDRSASWMSLDELTHHGFRLLSGGRGVAIMPNSPENTCLGELQERGRMQIKALPCVEDSSGQRWVITQVP